MRDRLIELIAKSNLVLVDGGIHPDTHQAQEALADYLLANGVIVPPCKVGQTVYCIRYDKARTPFVKPLGVLSVAIFGKGKCIIFTTKEDIWGITAFATEEEAEKALAERSENGT